MKKYLEKFVMFLHKKYRITPDILSYIRIFSAPWLALLVSQILSSKSLTLTIVTIILYILIIATDFLDGILARAISKEEKHDHPYLLRTHTQAAQLRELQSGQLRPGLHQ